MVNLEQTIADWRQKMLAAGIETPVPLEELELHLREEMERKVRAGMEAEKAFELAVKCIGNRHELKREFQNAGTMKGRSYQRVYEKLLMLYAFYTGLITLGMIFGSSDNSPLYAGGSVAAFWLGLFRQGLVRKILIRSSLPPYAPNTELVDSVPTWVIVLNVLFVSAILATLLARRYRPKVGTWMTWLLTWAMLPSLPVGTLVGLYGVCCFDLDRFSEGTKPWFWSFLVFTKTPYACTNQGIALAARIICGLLTALIGWGFLWVGYSLAISEILQPSFPPNHLSLRLLLPSFTMFNPVVAFVGLAVGSWNLWWAWQIIRGPLNQQKMQPSHV